MKNFFNRIVKFFTTYPTIFFVVFGINICLSSQAQVLVQIWKMILRWHMPPQNGFKKIDL